MNDERYRFLHEQRPGSNWQQRFIERVRTGGIEQVLLYAIRAARSAATPLQHVVHGAAAKLCDLRGRVEAFPRSGGATLERASRGRG